MTKQGARLRITLLGGFDARQDPARPVTLPAGKVQALLAYLALTPGQAHPRDKLAALLWSDAPAEQARNSLRQTLFELRRALGTAGSTALRVGGDAVACDASMVETDVATFECLVAESVPSALEEAARLYRGDLLAGFRLAEAAFEDWLVSERERLRERALEALGRLLAHQRAADPDAAIQTALRLLALDPLQEAVHRVLMRLYLGLGRRGAALRQYQACVDVLRRELDVEPEDETRALYREILRARGAASPAPPRAAVPPPAWQRPEAALVGRARELTMLRQALEEARAGRGRGVLLLGEAGIGKSRLVEELSAEAQARGARVLLGRCHESEQILPFGPWADALGRGELARDAALLERLHPVARVELTRLVPELAEPDLRLATDYGDYRRLFEAVGDLLFHLAEGHPLVLVLEDLHWADELSLRLFCFVGRRVRTRRLLVVGTARDEELAASPALRRALDELRHESGLVELSVPPLSRADTLALVRALGRSGTEAATVGRTAERVWMISEGNPFVVLETLRALREQPETRAGGVGLPDRIREVIGARLERLGDRSRTLVAAAAVIGREFDFGLLPHVAALSEAEAAEGLEELVRRRVLREVGERFDFTHERIRDVAYDSLLPPRRKLLHRRVAEALEELYAEDLTPHYEALAVHCREGERWEALVEYLGRSADKAARRYAHEEALDTLRQALGHAERLAAPGRDARVLDLLLRHAALLHYLGRSPEIVDLLRREHTRLARTGDRRLAGPYHFRLAQAYSVMGDRGQADRAARQALDEAGRCEDRATMGKALTILAREAYWLGRPLEGIEHGRRAVAVLDSADDRHWLGLAHWLIGRHHGVMGDFERALEAEACAQAIGEAIGDFRLQSHAALTAGEVHAVRGDWETGIAVCRRAVELSPDPLNAANAAGHLGSAHLEQGDAVRAIPLLEQALEHFGRLPGGQARGWYTMRLGEAHLVASRLEEARDLTLQGLKILDGAGYRRGIAWAHRTLGSIARARGEISEAARQLGAALEGFTAVLAWFEVGRTHLALADVARPPGAGETATAHLREARRLFTRVGAPKYLARADELVAALGTIAARS